MKKKHAWHRKNNKNDNCVQVIYSSLQLYNYGELVQLQNVHLKEFISDSIYICMFLRICETNF